MQNQWQQEMEWHHPKNSSVLEKCDNSLTSITCTTSKQYRYNRLNKLYCKHIYAIPTLQQDTLHKSICKTFKNGQYLYCIQKPLYKVIIQTRCVFHFQWNPQKCLGNFQQSNFLLLNVSYYCCPVPNVTPCDRPEFIF